VWFTQEVRETKINEKNFWTITIMMGVLLFLFQMSGLVQQADKEYGINIYATYATNEEEDQIVSKPGWDTETETDPRDFAQGAYVAYLGDLDQTSVGKTVREWCRYTKRAVWEVTSLAQWQFPENNLPEILLIDSDFLRLEEDTERLVTYTDQGIHLIFCNLPPAEQAMTNDQFRNLLGIRQMISENITVSGFHLFAGFMLGGETYYEATTEAEARELQDLDLNVTWYYTDGGVETYMVGILSEEQRDATLGDMDNVAIINGYLPAILWLHSLPEARVFVINGDYMEDATGLGILSAMVSRLHTYDIYPVINAQTVVLNHFPWIAAGNNPVLEAMYNRNSKEVLRDVVWPSMVAIMEQNNIIPTCLLQLQFAYDGSETPLESDLMSYIRLLREVKAEVGLALSSDTALTTEQKVAADQENLTNWLPDFAFYSFASSRMSDREWEAVKQDGLLPQVKTIFTEWEKGKDVIGYETQSVTRQSGINYGFTHTFSDDLRLKSLETVLAYSSISVDMEKIAEPETQEDSWEKKYERLAANTSTYWKPYSAFAKTTLIQSDAKIRKFFTLTYNQERIGNIVTVDIQNVTGEVDFLLRTFQEKVDQVEGGSFRLIEEGVYLITTDQPHMKITLDPEEAPFFY
jgi:hypothetical protein